MLVQRPYPTPAAVCLMCLTTTTTRSTRTKLSTSLNHLFANVPDQASRTVHTTNRLRQVTFARLVSQDLVPFNASSTPQTRNTAR